MSTLEITCPSGLTIKVRGLKIGDYDILSSAQGASSARILDAFDEILAACVVDVVVPGDAGPSFISNGKIKWSKALLTDRFAALLGIRRATADQGSEHSFKHECPECGHKDVITVELDTLDVAMMADGAAAQIGRGQNVFEAKLSDGTPFKFRAWTGDDERKLAKVQRNMADKKVSASIACRLTQLGDKTVEMDIRRALADLDVDAIAEFGEAIDLIEGGVDTTVSWECRGCGEDLDVSIPFDGGLLFPTRKKKRNGSS